MHVESMIFRKEAHRIVSNFVRIGSRREGRHTRIPETRRRTPACIQVDSQTAVFTQLDGMCETSSAESARAHACQQYIVRSFVPYRRPNINEYLHSSHKRASQSRHFPSIKIASTKIASTKIHQTNSV